MCWENKMQAVFLVSLMAFISISAFAGECSKLLESGKVKYELQLKSGELGTFTAELEIRENVKAYGDERTVNIHTFNMPKFEVNGKNVKLTRDALELIAKGLGYERVEYVVLKSGKGKYLNSNLEVVKLGALDNSIALVDSNAHAIFYHSIFSNWQY